jgi:3-hydroxy-9,10-secoandrosta-1,3,5(10)-triene-9,17-dione monooxygenase reductase component
MSGPEGAPSVRADDDHVARRVLWSLPTGLYLLGSTADAEHGPWNLMTTSLVTQVATEPRVVGLAVEQGSATLRLVRASSQLSLSILARADRAVVRRFVKPVTDLEIGVDGRPISMAGHGVHLGTNGAPILDAAVAWLELQMVAEQEFASHVVVLAEVRAAGAIDDVLEGSASDRHVEILRMEDTRMSYGG